MGPIGVPKQLGLKEERYEGMNAQNERSLRENEHFGRVLFGYISGIFSATTEAGTRRNPGNPASSHPVQPLYCLQNPTLRASVVWEKKTIAKTFYSLKTLATVNVLHQNVHFKSKN